MFSASRTSSVRRWPAIAQPTTRRLKASSTTATYRNPVQVLTYVMSATHSRSAAEALKSRSTKSGATRAARCSRVVVLAERLRLTPAIPAARISRPTRFAPIRLPSSRSSAWMRGRVVGVPDLLDPLGQLRIAARSCRRLVAQPCVVAAGGDTQHPTQGAVSLSESDLSADFALPRNAVTSSSSNTWISLWTWLRTQSSNCSHSGLDSDLPSVLSFLMGGVSPLLASSPCCPERGYTA